jgi:hypothetical protein
LTVRLAELRAVLGVGGDIYADGFFSLRHEINRTKSARPGRWSRLVPAPIREEVNGIVQPLDRAWTIRTDRIRVPAPMSEDVNGGESPHVRAWTNRMDAIRVPAPMREEATEIAQPLDRAWTTPKRRVANVVPAPRLELESESRNDLRSILYELAKNAKLEMKRGNKGAVEELLEVFIESGEKFSTFEKNILENGKRSEPFAKGGKGSAPFAGFSKGLPFVAEGSQ